MSPDQNVQATSMIQPKPSRPAVRRRFVYSFCVMAACLAENVTLNLSAIILHSFSTQKLGEWLALSHDLTYSIAKFVPAIFYVGRHMTMAGYYSRMEFVENVLAMNFLISMVYVVSITIVGTVEIAKDKEGAQYLADVALRAVREKEKTNLFQFAMRSRATMAIFSLCFWIFITTLMYSGGLFTWDVFPLYTYDLELIFISVVFGFIQVSYFSIMFSLAAAILRPSSRRKAIQP